MRMKRLAALSTATALGWGGLATGVEAGAAEAGDQFAAYVSESQEVPRNASEAWCWAIFEVGESSLDWGMRCFDVENVVAGHLHLAPRGSNGPVVAPLLPAGKSTSGEVVDFEGSVTAADLVGPLAGASFEDLLEAIEDGRVYTNLHSDDGVAPPNTGPGDLAAGEVRGQLVPWS